MTTFIEVNVYTPAGNCAPYMYMDEFNNPGANARFLDFLNECRLDCADRYQIPNSWKDYDFQQWFNNTWAQYKILEVVESY